MSESKIDMAIQLAVDGLLCDGEQYKQWYFEQIIDVLGANLQEIKEAIRAEGYDFEPGIPP